MAEIADELRKACSGHPHAKIAWPHRLLHRAADELDAKDKRIAELEAGRWQPIETAPKGGTAVILYCPQGDGNPGSTYRVTAGQWFSSDGGTTEYRDSEGRWIGQDDEEPWAGWVSMDGGFSEDTMMPTHWHPLPAPPSLLNKEDRNG